MKKEKIIAEVKKITQKNLPGGFRVFLFGSWAKGNATETSDLDIGIFGDQKVPNDIMFKIRQEVEEVPTLRKIDVVDLNLTSEHFRRAALEHAKPL